MAVTYDMSSAPVLWWALIAVVTFALSILAIFTGILLRPRIRKNPRAMKRIRHLSIIVVCVLTLFQLINVFVFRNFDDIVLLFLAPLLLAISLQQGKR